MDKNPPADPRDTGLIPGPGRFPMLEGDQAHVPQSLKSECLVPMLGNQRSQRNETHGHQNEEEPPLSCN